MELEFTEDQHELRAAVRNVLERECPMSFVREVVEKDATPDVLWRRIVDLGWPALTIAEEDGGLGLGWVELAVVLEELGRAVAPVPYLATLTQFAPVVAEAGDASQRARFLGAVANGDATGALVTGGQATADGVLRGTGGYSLDAPVADELAVVADLDDGRIGLFVVPASATRIDRVTPLDTTRPIGRVTFDDVTVEADRVLSLDGAVAWGRARQHAVVGVAIETVGTCQSIFDVALEHAKTREQFGVPIGSFQAIKHKFADLLVALEKARATAYFAAACLAEDDERRELAASMAKAAAGDCQRAVAQEGIQVLGGIGYTWEHDMHLYVKRAKTGEALLGSTHEHRARVAELAGLGPR